MVERPGPRKTFRFQTVALLCLFGPFGGQQFAKGKTGRHSRARFRSRWRIWKRTKRSLRQTIPVISSSISTKPVHGRTLVFLLVILILILIVFADLPIVSPIRMNRANQPDQAPGRALKS